MELLNKTDKEIIEIISPLINNMESAWDNNDHSSFIENFSTDMREAATEEDFNEQRSHLFPLYGKSTRIEPALIHKNKNSINIIWKKHCEKLENPVLLICTFEEEHNNIVISSAFLPRH